MIEFETSRRGFIQTMATGAAALSALGLGASVAHATESDKADASAASGVSDTTSDTEADPFIPDYVATTQLAAQTPRKIAILLGAGQDTDLGNTSKLAYEFARGAREMGHEVTTFFLGGMTINPCLGCGHCRQSEDRTCIWDDDMQQIVDAYWNYDMIVFATPMRYWMVTGMLKNAIERLFYRVADGSNIYDLPHDWHETYRRLDSALLISSADTGWYTYNWVREWYHTCLCNYIGMQDRGHLFVGGCGEYSWGANEDQHRQGSTKHIEDTGGLEAAYEFGRSIYADESVAMQLVEASEYNMQK